MSSVQLLQLVGADTSHELHREKLSAEHHVQSPVRGDIKRSVVPVSSKC